MAMLREIKGRSRHVAGPVLAASLLLYFAYHAVQGERGLLTLWQLERQVAAADQQLTRLAEEQARLDNRVRLLRPESLDPDMLDERARTILGVVAQDDVVILDEFETR